MTKAKWLLGAALAASGVAVTGVALLTPPSAFAKAKDEAAAKAAAQKVGAKVAKPLQAAQEAMTAKNWDQAMVHIAEAQAIEPKTPYEQYMTNEMLLFVQLNTKKYVEAAATLETQLASGQMPEADVKLRTKTLTQLHYQNQNFPKAIEVGNKYLTMEPGDKEVQLLVAQTYALAKDYPGAVKVVQQSLAAGGVPDEQMLRIGLRSAYEMKDRAGTVAMLEQLVRHYPSKDYWRDLLNNNLFQTKEDRELRHLYRLMDDVGTLDEGDNCAEAAGVLITGGFPSEASRILDGCSAANLFQGDLKTRVQPLTDQARSGAAADRKELAGADAALAAAKTGNDMVSTGKLFFSTSEYGKAADAISKGLTKGGVTDAVDANMLLGIAQLRSGQAPAAIETFKGITDAKAAPIARLWGLKAEGATAPAAPAPAATG